MNTPIFNHAGPVTLVGGGPLGPDDLALARGFAPTCVAADGGARHLIHAGLLPEAVIGDFDSLPDALRAQLPSDRLFPLSDQQTTDFDKVLTRVSAPACLGVGFLGGRIDHQLAAFHTLAAHPDRPCILIGETEIALLAPPHLSLPTRAGETVSLFPLARCQGRSTGLEWPLDDLQFDPLRFVGTSNRAVGPVTLRMDAPTMLALLPRRLIQPVLAQLVAPSAQWNARV